MNVLDSLSLVRRFLEAENARDWHAWSSYLHPTVTYATVGSTTVVEGREEYVANMQRIYTELPDWTFRLVHIFGDEEAVIVEFDGSGHFSGTYKSVRYVRAPLRLSAVCIFDLSDGLILSVREYFDHVGYEHQLQLASRK